MPTTIDFGQSDDPEAVARFWRALEGKKRQRKKTTTTTTRAQRAAPGEGNRQEDLAALAAAGYTIVWQQDGLHWLYNPATGAETPRQLSYRAALDVALALVQVTMQT